MDNRHDARRRRRRPYTEIRAYRTCRVLMARARASRLPTRLSPRRFSRREELLEREGAPRAGLGIGARLLGVESESPPPRGLRILRVARPRRAVRTRVPVGRHVGDA